MRGFAIISTNNHRSRCHFSLKARIRFEDRILYRRRHRVGIKIVNNPSYLYPLAVATRRAAFCNNLALGVPLSHFSFSSPLQLAVN